MGRKKRYIGSAAVFILVAAAIIYVVNDLNRFDTMAQQAEKTSVKSDKNRLQFEQSPYLLQHADNPVDWYTWGEKAFAAARRENKPVFLSIGYSTCHWCHVMEHESFEDPEVAALMNEIFINIKYVLLGEKHTSCQDHIPRHAGFRGPDLL